MTNTTSTLSKQRVAANGVWMIANSIASRAAGLVCQLVLAWLLMPEQFGLIAMASSMAVLVDLVSQFGLSDVLISRHRRIHLWRPAAYTISFVLGMLAAGVMLLLAVVASYVYDDVDLGWIVAIMAIAAPIRGLSIVHYTQLRAEMLFRPIAMVQALGALVNMFVAVLLAALGFGAYSFAWAKVADSIFQTVGWVRIAKLEWPSRFTLRGARFLLADSMRGYATSFCNNVVQQSDYLILGLFAAKGMVGGYFLAFTISVQAISLIAINLTTVLFPALSSLSHNPKWQTLAFIRSSKMLAFIGMPLCLLQAFVAAPLIPLIFKSEWHWIVPLIQIMSVGTALRCASFSWEALLKSQRRFSTVAVVSASAAVVFMSVVAFSSYIGGVHGCAIGVAIYYAAMSPLQLYIAIRNTEGALKQVLDLCLRSLVISGVAFGAAWLLAMPLRNAGMPIVEMVTITLIGAVLYWGVSWKANPSPVSDMGEVLLRIREKLTASRSQTQTKAT